MRAITREVIYCYADLGIEDRKYALQILMKVIRKEQIRDDESQWIYHVASQQNDARKTRSHSESGLKTSTVKSLKRLEKPTSKKAKKFGSPLSSSAYRHGISTSNEKIDLASLGRSLQKKRRRNGKNVSLAQTKQGNRTNHYTGRGNRSV